MSQGADGATENPRLRPVETRWVSQGGQRLLHLSDPLRISGRDVLVPAPLAPVLALCDGTRSADGLHTALALRNGLAPSLGAIRSLVRELDEALLLEGGRFEAALKGALAAYRQAPARPPALAGVVYPSDPRDLETAIGGFYAQAPPRPDSGRPAGPVVGALSPHIDYGRGHPVYAALWRELRPALESCDLVVLLGTDHQGGAGTLTLTRQHYATPWGTLPTELEVVEALVRSLGEGPSLEGELRHAAEHSIELAAVWLHHAVRSLPRPPGLVPILCGDMERSPEGHEGYTRLLETLGLAMRNRRSLVIAAGDLAHVGPAFGDQRDLDLAGRARLQAEDAAALEAVCRSDSAGLLDGIRDGGDWRRWCGLAPAYLALRLLGRSVAGEVTGYAVCPADTGGGSVVSVAGVLWRAAG